MLQRLRQKIHELERELEENGTPLDQFRRERDIARLLVNSAHSDTEETRSDETGSEETGSEETGPEESCSEAEGSGDDGLEDLDTRRLGSYEEGDSEADELEEEEDILEEEESEADELEEETGEEHSNEEDCSPEETGGEGEEDDDERYQNEEEARPSIKAERIAQIADQEILNTESRYWAPVERNTGATIKQESRPSVARSLPRKSASISADEDNDMRIASGTHIQDERQPSDRSEADSKDELCNGVKSESRIHAQDAARLGNDIERSNVVKTYYPRTPIPPLEFPGSVTLRFSSPQDWERRWHRAQRRTGIRMVIFEPSFAVTVADINLLAWSPAAFSSSILAIRVGNGALLDDQSITNLAANMAQLTQVQIDLAPSIGDQSIMSLIEFCPAIEYIEICGDLLTRRYGGVTLRNLDAILIANEDKAQRLRNLVLVDQLVEDKSVKACEEIRANLKIIRGHQTREEIIPRSRA
ncbi:hypothetical protein J4E85_002274 [Alternaria conjuncta]|uniref:uncharacterized protein n=1 Tax=Alternaria conjuncta TaxID=181017 RepID=UPI00221F5A07|nr:uncharacterized protein J4E85_002274 [Alternaria conjuncta]KAI4934418.1 hypothetical protein J4E85_002274 [Alternaria conjuncta]